MPDLVVRKRPHSQSIIQYVTGKFVERVERVDQKVECPRTQHVRIVNYDITPTREGLLSSIERS